MRWMAGALALFVVGALLAGCSQPEAEGEPSPTEAPERERLSRPGRGGQAEDDRRDEEEDDDWEEDATVRVFSEEYALSATAATSVLGFGGFDGAGCVSIEGAPFTILGGNATLVWSAQTPAAERLALVTQQVYGDYYYEQVAGTSPLEADIPELPTAEVGSSGSEDGYYAFSVDAGDLASVAYGQDVRLVLTFEYLAEDEVRSRAGC